MAFDYNNLVEEWRLREYEKNVYIAAQQKDSRLSSMATWGTQASKLKSYDVIGSTEMVERTTRFGDTPNISLDHARRSVYLKEYHWGTLIDDIDTIRTVNDPKSSYTAVMTTAAKRKMDRIFIEKALGTALDGEDATVSTALPNAQHIAAVSAGALSGLNIETLRLAKYKFDAADIDPMETRYFAITAKQLQDLLAETEITSADYNTVKALVRGEIDTFMGFKFIMCNLLDKETTAMTYNLTTGLYDAGGTSAINGRRCIAWVPSGMRMTTGKGFNAKIAERPDKNHIPQIYGWMSIGGVRMEDVKVVEVNCKE